MPQPSSDAAPVCWVVTDGRAGIEAQALGLAEAIARLTPLSIVRKRVRVRAPWKWLPRALSGDAFARLGAESDALDPPSPDLWIGCGRLSVPLTIGVKARSPATFTIMLQDPRAPLSRFDLVIAPDHDGLAGPNVVPIVGSTNRVSGRAATRMAGGGARGGGLTVAVLIGGPNRAFRLGAREAMRIAGDLQNIAATGASLLVTTSRRTPAEASAVLEAALKPAARAFWRAGVDNDRDNPYPLMLDGADAVLVTEDSVNMAVEAAATGRPVFIIKLPRKLFASARKFDAFHASLRARGAARDFDGHPDRWRLEEWAYAPLDETARAAREVVARWRPHIRVFDEWKR